MRRDAILHPELLEMVAQTGIDEKRVSELFEKYDIFSVSVPVGDIPTHYCRGLTLWEYNQLKRAYGESDEMIDAIYQLCVLYPPFKDAEEKEAGTIISVSRAILGQAGLNDDRIDQIKADMEMYDKEMESFLIQVPCVVHEAFSDLSLEEIEQFPLTKLLQYYSKAKWVLSNLRGMQPQQQKGTSPADVDPRDFPELKDREKFRKGQLHPKTPPPTKK